MVVSLSTLQLPALPPLHSLLVMLLGIYVTLDLGLRVRRVAQAERLPWRVASALALVVVLCSGMLLGLAEALSGLEPGFDIATLVMAMLASAALALLGLGLYFRAASARAQGLGAASLLGAATLASQTLVLSSLGLSPGVQWNFAMLALAWLTASAGFAAGHGLMTGTRPAARAVQRQLLATAIVCVSLLAAQALAIEAAGLPGQALMPLEGLMPVATLAPLVAFGGAEMLLLMLLACAVETRLRGTLDRARATLHSRGLQDELTGLPNRVGFEQLLARSQPVADAAKGTMALLVVALDGFKTINEGHGHQCGDELLCGMARRLQDLAAPQHVARLGGDEFLLLLCGNQAAQQASALARRVLDAVAVPCLIDGRELRHQCLGRRRTVPAARCGVGADHPRQRSDARRQTRWRRNLLLLRFTHDGRYTRPGRHAARPARGHVARADGAVLPAEDPRS